MSAWESMNDAEDTDQPASELSEGKAASRELVRKPSRVSLSGLVATLRPAAQPAVEAQRTRDDEDSLQAEVEDVEVALLSAHTARSCDLAWWPCVDVAIASQGAPERPASKIKMLRTISDMGPVRDELNVPCKGISTKGKPCTRTGRSEKGHVFCNGYCKKHRPAQRPTREQISAGLESVSD